MCAMQHSGRNEHLQRNCAAAQSPHNQLASTPPLPAAGRQFYATATHVLGSGQPVQSVGGGCIMQSRARVEMCRVQQCEAYVAAPLHGSLSTPETRSCYHSRFRQCQPYRSQCCKEVWLNLKASQIPPPTHHHTRSRQMAGVRYALQSKGSALPQVQ
jgi:hypothetical protein